jgi:hypothetical protein
MNRCRKRSRRIVRDLVLASFVLATAGSSARADHPSHEAPLPVSFVGGGGAQLLSTLTLFPRSEVGLAGRFLRLKEPRVSGARHVAVEDLYGRFAVRPWLDLFLGIPVIATLPLAGDDGYAGLGDVRAGLRLTRRMTDWLRLGTTLETSAPTGSRERGLGLGAWGSRLSAFAAFDLRRNLVAVAEIGTAWNWGAEGVALDQRAAIFWSMHRRLSGFLDIQSRVQLQDGPAEALAAVRTKEAGDTQVVFTPGVTLRLGDAMSVWGGPAIPVGHPEFEMGFVLGASLGLP